MIGSLISAVAAVSPVGQPAAAGPFVARFDCQVTSTLGQRPNGTSRQIITIRSWEEYSKVFIERRFEDKILSEEAIMGGVDILEFGQFEVTVYSFGEFSLKQATRGHNAFSYLGSHLVFDAGFADDIGTCTAKIKKLPKEAKPDSRIK